MPIGQF